MAEGGGGGAGGGAGWAAQPTASRDMIKQRTRGGRVILRVLHQQALVDK